MKTVLEIGSSLNCGAPGKIAEQIGVLAKDNGWDVYMAHGLRHSNPSSLKTLPMVSTLQETANAIYSILLDRHGLGVSDKTSDLVNWIKTNKPDVIHLHNIHGYFLNYKTLFEYLDTTSIPIVWTLHDCWPFTGHCAYFDSIDCQKWKTQCCDCKLKSDYPRSLFIDNSRQNYTIKKRLFTGLKNCTMVPVSNWLGEITKQSFMGKYPVRVIHNGIDLNVFKPTNTGLRERLGIDERKVIVLGVASPWVPRKGYNDIVRLSEKKEFQIVMVGVTEDQKKSLPANIISVRRTQNQQELAEYYSMADVFVNPTYSDNFPTTNIEALACGTPVITYRTGGSPEAIDEKTGIVVNQGNLKAMADAIFHLKRHPLSSDDCRKRAEEKFNKDKCFEEYITLYNMLINNKLNGGGVFTNTR